MNKAIVIEKEDLLRNFIKDKLEQYNFTVLTAKNGFEGLIKIKNENPDLIVMNAHLDRQNSIDLLKEKMKNKFTMNIPVILMSNTLDKAFVHKYSQFKIYKFMPIPIKIDILINAVRNIFKMNIEVDTTPCLIDIHLNDDILFIEIADGFNSEKIDLLKYRIQQMKNIYKTNFSKVLVLLTNIENSENIEQKYKQLMTIISNDTGAKKSAIKILSTSNVILEVIKKNEEFKQIELKKDFTDAIDSLGKIDVFTFGQEIDNIKTDLISQPKELISDQHFELNFKNEMINNQGDDYDSDDFMEHTIAIIDDDLHILEYMATVLQNTGWNILTYESGTLFLSDLSNNRPDLIFLDIMMPVMTGFDVIKYLKDNNVITEIVIVSALNNKDIVIKAHQFGIKNFMSKPLDAKKVIKKAQELLSMSFK